MTNEALYARKLAAKRIKAILTLTNTSAADIMCDMIHWCDKNDMYFDELLEEAKLFYLADVEEGEIDG
jgi:hypothetical protein